MRDVGRMGEDTFSLLCNTVGLSANRIQVDKTGWDYLVEFPEQTIKSLPLDMREGSFQCKFQVKATDKKLHSVPITLSNLNRLAKDPLPTFICLLGFYSEDSVRDLFCVHVNEALIGMILKSIRKHESAGKTQLNKSHLNIKFSQKTKLTNASGDELAAYVRSCIGNSLESYTNNKLNSLKQIGYSEQKFGFRCSFDNDEFTKLENSYLGYPTAININDVTGFTTRFSIELPDIALKAEKAILQITPKPLSDVLLKFQEDKLSNPIIFKSTFFVSPSLNKSKVKVRIVNKFFEFILDFNSTTINFDVIINENTEMTIDELLGWLKFSKLINKNDVIMTIEPPSLPSMEFVINPNSTFPDFTDAYLLSNKILNIFRYFEINENHILKMKEIDWNHEQIGQLDHIIRSKSGDYKFSFDFNSKIETLPNIENIAGVVRLRFHFFDLFFTLIVSVNGGLTLSSDGRHEIISNQFRIHHKWFSNNCFASDKELNKYVDAIVMHFEEQGIPVVRYQPED